MNLFAPDSAQVFYPGAELRAGLTLTLAPHSSAVVTYRCVD